MTIVIILIAVFSITLGAFGALWAQDYWRQRTAPRELKPILDWRPTLRTLLDLVGPAPLVR